MEEAVRDHCLSPKSGQGDLPSSSRRQWVACRGQPPVMLRPPARPLPSLHGDRRRDRDRRCRTSLLSPSAWLGRLASGTTPRPRSSPAGSPRRCAGDNHRRGATFAGLAGVATSSRRACLLCHNHSFGVKLGRGALRRRVVAQTSQTAEGEVVHVDSSASRKNGVDVPIIRAGHAMIVEVHRHGRCCRVRAKAEGRLTGRSQPRESRRAADRSRGPRRPDPTESRSKLSGTTSGSFGRRRRRSIWVSTPPRLVECEMTCTAAQTASASLDGGADTSKATIAPTPG